MAAGNSLESVVEGDSPAPTCPCHKLPTTVPKCRDKQATWTPLPGVTCSFDCCELIELEGKPNSKFEKVIYANGFWLSQTSKVYYEWDHWSAFNKANILFSIF